MTSTFRLIILFTISLSINLAYAQDIVRYVDSKNYPDPKQSYFVDLLALALEASKDKYGDYLLQPTPIEMAQARTSMMLQREQYVDITWRMTSKDLEKKLNTVYFPILKGLMGYRILIIPKNKKAKFPDDLTIDNLKKIHLGQGHNWPDSKILSSNGFSVITGYDNYLFSMLKKGRFDGYPRAIHEPWLEIANEPELMVEDRLMIKYAAPIFFFVNKSNHRLQERLTFGLNELLTTGEFEQFFLNHPITSDTLLKANVKNRTVFELHNPLLSEKTKALLKDERLWINVE